MNEETLKEFKERIRTEYSPRYYDRQGNEIDLLDWGDKCADMEYKIIKQEMVGKYFVSTIWVGLNMQIFRHLPTEIFETMIFMKDGDQDSDDPLNHYQERYSTEEEAIRGHQEAVFICEDQIILEKKIKEESQAEENAKG